MYENHTYSAEFKMKFSLVLIALAAAAVSADAETPVYKAEYLPATPVNVSKNLRIVGGFNAERNQFPYQVSLQRRGLITFSHICGGTIISPNWVLTAAHCTPDGNTYRVVAGIILQSDVNVPGQQTIAVAQVINNALYPGNNVVAPNDVSLLHLASSLIFGESVRALPIPPRWHQARGEAILSGWGLTRTGGSIPDHLQFANLPIVPERECDEILTSLLGTQHPFNEELNVCSGIQFGGESACNGDSGGPLFNDGFVVGVVSWVLVPCGAFNAPSVYDNRQDTVIAVNIKIKIKIKLCQFLFITSMQVSLVFSLLTSAVLATANYSNYNAAYLDTPLKVSDGLQIIGGFNALRNQFPYQVSVQRLWILTYSHVCGGSIISSNWVLTASHCTTSGTYRVVAGIVLQTDENVFGQQTLAVSEIINHPLYPETDAVAPNDISLLRLSRSLIYVENVQPIPIPHRGYVAEGDAVLTGWGLTRPSALTVPNHLQFAYLPIVPGEECDNILNDLLGDRNPFDVELNVCSGIRNGGESACSGDSGGPLVNNGLLVGVVSWVLVPCGGHNAPTVYGKTSAFTDWIVQNTNGEVEPAIL
ncbi:hypothetical protein HUJ05_003596 [Dendroctonus ponderosae]|nr:hypothetical protein HUJ05_003596 [Dendroctonus ponderosae]